MGRFEIPDGWTVQAFQFALHLTPAQAACVRRQFGGRRKARNWAVATLKADLDRYRQSGQATSKPRHQRDDNASINLARYEDTAIEAGSGVGPVRAAVKRGADPKTGPRPAGGCEARKGDHHMAVEQPRDGVPVR